MTDPYVAESRSKGATWTMIAEAPVHDAEKRSRALGDASPITERDLWGRVAADMASKPYKALGTDLVEGARANRQRAVDAFIQQSHRLESMQAAGRDPGKEARRYVRDLVADRALGGSRAAIGAALQGTETGLRGVGQEIATNERGRRVRAFVREVAEASPDERSGSRVRRLVQAEAVRKQLARHVAGLDEALQRNAQNLRGLGQDITTHLQGTRAKAETARRDLEAAVRRPSSPSPGSM